MPDRLYCLWVSTCAWHPSSQEHPPVAGLVVLALQVESLLEGPRLQHKLDNERAIIKSLMGLNDGLSHN